MTSPRRALKVAGIVGPTAAGKSAIALELAPRLGAEIVSIDSMQVYLDMDVGTAKPTRAMRAEVPHHLLDLKPPGHDLTVAEFQSLARAAIDNISRRGLLPLLVGGSGLYFRAVVDELSFPPRSAEVRESLEAEVEALGTAVLHARLVRLDPAAAERIEPANARRIVRALEVIELTGRPFSDNDAWDRYESVYDLCVAGLTLDRPLLFERIEGRVDRMLAAGLIEEARALSRRPLGRTARQALGYRQVLEAPEGAGVDEIREEIVRATKRFARRQESWFRADPRISWFDASDEEAAGAVMDHFRGALRLA
ncbi:MAG: tRNA (adenosine(37)-N6)-dimethylallyltransferase MiaA [Actinomycetota bacterium]